MADWTLQEVDLIIADYMSMLTNELAGIDYSKTIHRRNLASLLNRRSEGSIEFKHCNISAVMVEMGLPFIKGYKPRFNRQELLVERCEHFLQLNQAVIEPAVKHFVEEPVADYQMIAPAHLVIEPPPQRKDEEIQQRGVKARSPFKINYLEREQKNQRLGHFGEEMAMAYERQRLIGEGQEQWVEKIEWISVNDDGAGFDILSFEKNGKERYIEVKTTKLTKETPIYFSQREYEFSCVKRRQYHLYRVFNASEVPAMFMLNGSFDVMCRKEATQYRGFF